MRVPKGIPELPRPLIEALPQRSLLRFLRLIYHQTLPFLESRASWRFSYSESKYSSYGQYLKAFVNTADGSLETYVELEFKLENETDERYLIRRSWPRNGQRTRETIQVKKDGQDNTFLTDNWAMFIENILPSGLSSFFFFDGEKIAELAVENTNAQMKESIKTLLGISVLDLLDNDISRIVNRVGKRSNDQVHTKELKRKLQ